MSPPFVERELCVENLDEEPPLQQELTFGRSYRVWQQVEDTSPIPPKPSPINVPFELCRAVQKPHKKKKSKLCKCSLRPFCQSDALDPKMPLLDRSALPQSKYMDMLSIPHGRKPPCKKKKYKASVCCKCQVEPCPPRIIQMSVPNKRYVLQNWKDYQHILPAEMLVRFDQILKSGDNLEPRDARYYFKKLRRQKIKEMRKRKKLCRKKKEQKQKGELLWIKNQIRETVDAIVDYIKNEPLFMLNFQQMMTSNELLNYLANERVVKIRSRNTKCVYKKTVIEISDKLVKWMDTMNFFADIQPLDSKERLLEVPSLEAMLEEESEEEEISEPGYEDEGYDEDEFYGAAVAGGDAGQEEFMAKKLVDKTKLFDLDEEFEEGSVIDMLRGLDEDTLAKLIQILSQSPEDILSAEIDPENLPSVTYADILEKLKEIRDGNLLEKARKKLDLEEKMIEWARRNDPDQVDDMILDKIHETSGILGELFKNMDVSDFKKTMKEQDEDVGREIIEEVMEKRQDRGQVEATVFRESDEEGEEFREALGGEEEGEPGAPPVGAVGEGEERFIEGEEAGVPGGPGTAPGLEGTASEAEGAEEAVPGTEGTAPGAEGIVPGDEGIVPGDEGTVPGAEGTIPGGEEAGLGGPGAAGFGEGFEGEEAAFGRDYGQGEEDAFGGAVAEGASLGFGEGEGGFGEEGEVGFGPAEVEAAEEYGRAEEAYFYGAQEDLYGEAEDLLYGEEGFDEGEGYGLPPGVELGEEGEELIMGRLADELERLDSLLGVIRGHKPSVVYEHTPGTICCLSLKIWAVWLLEIANNAHNWTKWIGAIIKQVRHYVAIIRGDVLLPSGEKQVLYKEEWRKFVKDTEEKVVAWRQYSKHVKDLSTEIMENFHGKKVNCCPKCLQDHLIKNVVTAHETLQALTEAINCAGYWQRCLDRIVEQTSKITEMELGPESGAPDVTSLGSEGSYSIEIEELAHMPTRKVASEGSYGSMYEIEELPVPGPVYSNYDIVEVLPTKPEPSYFHEITEIATLEPPPKPQKVEAPKPAKPHKSNLKGKKKK
ncbi:hypothetical protein TcasGA2_TC006758 [Tribolium castaneum]|uniref:Uncharacterized protein n=1 Tax=Tribolium castaneum TaxID=7070 RepID=D6WZ26_TRICA|nr:hypothetical protein TcasGA2_TC006758 [Tribolium castaneum]